MGNASIKTHRHIKQELLTIVTSTMRFYSLCFMILNLVCRIKVSENASFKDFEKELSESLVNCSNSFEEFEHMFVTAFEKNPTNIYLFKVNNTNTRKRCRIRSKLTIKTPE